MHKMDENNEQQCTRSGITGSAVATTQRTNESCFPCVVGILCNTFHRALLGCLMGNPGCAFNDWYLLLVLLPCSINNVGRSFWMYDVGVKP